MSHTQCGCLKVNVVENFICGSIRIHTCILIRSVTYMPEHCNQIRIDMGIHTVSQKQWLVNVRLKPILLATVRLPSKFLRSQTQARPYADFLSIHPPK
jgi:hypothetical protein